MNTNVDLILSATQLLNKLNAERPLNAAKFHKNLDNIDQFNECFAYFFHKGSAAERHISHMDDFERILTATDDIDNKQVHSHYNKSNYICGVVCIYVENEIVFIHSFHLSGSLVATQR